MSEPDLAEIWAKSLNDLADMQIEPYQRAWLQLTRPLGLVENTALIATPNEFAKDQLENRLRALITNALSRELGRNIQLAVIIDPVATAAPTSSDDQQPPPEPLGIRIPFGTATDVGADDGDLARRADDQRGARSGADGLWDTGGAVPGLNGRQPMARPPANSGFEMPTGHFPLQPGPAGLPHLPAQRSSDQAAGSASPEAHLDGGQLHGGQTGVQGVGPRVGAGGPDQRRSTDGRPPMPAGDFLQLQYRAQG